MLASGGRAGDLIGEFVEAARLEVIGKLFLDKFSGHLRVSSERERVGRAIGDDRRDAVLSENESAELFVAVGRGGHGHGGLGREGRAGRTDSTATGAAGGEVENTAFSEIIFKANISFGSGITVHRDVIE